MKDRSKKRSQNLLNPTMMLSMSTFIFGLILLLDELWMFGIPFGGFLGDWSAFHVDPFHHWMLGVVLMLFSPTIYFVTIKRKNR